MPYPHKNFTFRRPLGVALSGGGALGSWQAACVESLIRGGLEFDHVLGFSAGSLTGAAYFLGRMEELLARWYDVKSNGLLKFSPRLFPFTLYSDKPLRESISSASDEKRAKRIGRCRLTVTVLRKKDSRPIYFDFSPGGRVWDAPLDAALMASCAIPSIFPQVRIGGDLYVDGGVPGVEPLSFKSLSECADVIVVEMVRPDEVGRKPKWPWEILEQKGRDLLRAQMNAGVDSLLSMRKGPRVFRLGPSKILELGMLTFKNELCRAALRLGYADGRRFLSNPAACRAVSIASEIRMGPEAKVLKPV